MSSFVGRDQLTFIRGDTVDRNLTFKDGSGTAIDITGTNITHAISYPITALYGISHGLAVGWTVHPSAEYQRCDLNIPNFEVNFEGINIDKKFIETISKEAMTYSKIHDAKRDITEERLIKLLENKI